MTTEQKNHLPALELRDVSYAYHPDSQVLEGVSMTVRNGDFLAVLGPNGGGKTTLLKIMLGLLRPDKGQVMVFGQTPQASCQNVGYVPQFATTNSAFPISALDLVLTGAARRSRRHGAFWKTGPAERDQARRLLMEVGLPNEQNRPFNALSGGQRQRVLVARALMGRAALAEDEPFLLLLDEPTSNIDPKGKFCFYEYLGELRGKLSIVLVSHDLTLASPFFSAVALVNRTLTLVDKMPSAQVLAELLGAHEHACPVGDLLQHAEQFSPDENRLV